MFLKFFEIMLVLVGFIHFKIFSKKFTYEKTASVQNFQLYKLKKIVRTAYNDIPFYKQKFDEAGFHPDDLVSLSDFSKVPVLSKSEAKKYSEELINHNKSSFSLEFKTSGSTGEPFKSYISPFHWIVEQSCIWRHWSWAGYKFRDRMAIVRSYVPKNDDDLIRWDKLRNFIYFSPFHLTDKHVRAYLNRMLELNVKFIRGYPSSLLIIADYILRNPKTPIPNFKAALTASEMLGENQRAKIEKAFNCKVYNHYGLAEQIVMLGTCEETTHLHNYEEYGYLELLPTNNNAYKMIVGTNLNNFAMPLIRYETGDIALIDNSTCKCDRTSTTILNVIGRSDSTIKMNDGSEIPVTNFYTLLEHYNDDFSAWQLIQVDEQTLKLVVKLTSCVDLDVLKKKLELDFQRRLMGKMHLDYDFDGKFHYVGEGKRNPFIRL